MIAQSALTFRSPSPAAMPVAAATMALRRTCAVQLFDCRTGSARRINGGPLVIYTRNPDAAVADLLEGRDPAKWEARIREIEKGVR
jgi:hypothetical protein